MIICRCVFYLPRKVLGWFIWLCTNVWKIYNQKKYERVPVDTDIDITPDRQVDNTTLDLSETGDDTTDGWYELDSMVKHTEEKISVQVYNCKDNLKHFVGDMLKQVNADLDVIYITQASDISQNLPLLVVCFNNSRLGTDATKAIQDVSDPASAVLVVFHHKESHALPSQPSDNILVEHKFKLYGIYDIACVTGKGVYQHDMNTQSIGKLQHYIEQYKSRCVMVNDVVDKTK